MSSAVIKSVPSIEKVLKGKSGKTVRIKVLYDSQMDVLTKDDGSPLPDILVIDGIKVDLRKFKPKWKKELQAIGGQDLKKPKSKKKPVTAFLKEDLSTDFQELPDVYDVLYEGLTVQDISCCQDTQAITQLSANLRYGTFSKKDLFIMCNFDTVIHIVIRAKEPDRAALDSTGNALAKALKGKLSESPLKPAGMVESAIDINSKDDRYKQVMTVLNALNTIFFSVDIHQVLLSRVPSEYLESIGLDRSKQKNIKHHFG